jgi:hypothetical protein
VKEVVSALLIDLGWPARQPVRPGRHRANACEQEHVLARFGTMLQEPGTPYFNVTIVEAA